jgi:hypothetical protein
MRKPLVEAAILFLIFQTCAYRSARATGSSSIEPEPFINIQEASVVPLPDYLFGIGNKLGCYFTLEYRSYEIAGPRSKAHSVFTNDTSVPSLEVLVSNLRRELPGFNIEPDSRSPKIIHIVEQSLATDNSYVLKEKQV